MANHPGDTEYMTTREVAALLRVRERKVYELAASGEIPCRRVTGKLLFPRADVEAWLAGGERIENAGPPDIVAGSHDPLLDWALRESGCGLATFFDGSLDGLERIAAGGAVACGMHVIEPPDDAWNVGHVEEAVGRRPFVLIEWAKRRQGLIVPPGGSHGIGRISDLKGRLVAARQPKSGGRILFDHLLAAAGMTAGEVSLLDNPARTETEAAAAVAGGDAEAAVGLESMARMFRLDFVPLTAERYDLLIDRRAFFEPPMQRLLGFCRASRFAEQADALGGYDLGGQGTVHWNGP